MIVHTPISTCVKSVVRLRGCVQGQVGSNMCVVSQTHSSSSCLCMSSGHSKLKYISMSVPKTYCSSVFDFQALRGSCLGSGISKQRGNWRSLTLKSLTCCRAAKKACIDISFGCQNMNVRVLVPKQKIPSKIKCHVGPVSWPRGCASSGVVFGLLICCSSSKQAHAEAARLKEGIPGDGRCLFRSVAHGACLRSGKPAPSESLQRELADELRARVADEFVKRREETEWFIEGNFDTYVSQIRKPHIWGGEPELLMASHVLQMPITVYMHDENSGGLISIAEYGQEYGKENPIRLLYHGFGHYDALQIPGKNTKSRL
ncbi:OVARIAN TUMOR DOMAIN-containing deubiquitinating enzyme 4 isoform X2 [Malania oleifera]|uniref:OVARIAN TUMOR DOMAIN-containing deubiquitinating enzyme 4 isoform X2 n=1 Tax=Malania oleifera TaxID=397392 RepID=UPI0025AE21E8|nr:OVARIAN TUMOR DOMAIN-containing deubiquitinating enzyme 4 isoform X2 [Malania oleifera]